MWDPRVPPLYADYGPGFCATPITSGARDLFPRGADAAPHVGNGMRRLFEWDPEIPEDEQLLDEIAAFLARHMG